MQVVETYEKLLLRTMRHSAFENNIGKYSCKLKHFAFSSSLGITSKLFCSNNVPAVILLLGLELFLTSYATVRNADGLLDSLIYRQQ